MHLQSNKVDCILLGRELDLPEGTTEMKTYPLTRDVTINEELIVAGTTVKASYDCKTGRTMVVVDGIGRKSFQVAPVRL